MSWPSWPHLQPLYPLSDGALDLSALGSSAASPTARLMSATQSKEDMQKHQQLPGGPGWLAPEAR